LAQKKLHTGGAEARERTDAAEEQEQGAPSRAGEPPQCPQVGHLSSTRFDPGITTSVGSEFENRITMGYVIADIIQAGPTLLDRNVLQFLIVYILSSF